ncbi:MAG: hypothetical protein GX456_17385 [Verrucomicrobia bacterium]|nr:hypothetical protein [Verrucomicrobiota bacterium]
MASPRAWNSSSLAEFCVCAETWMVVALIVAWQCFARASGRQGYGALDMVRCGM